MNESFDPYLKWLGIRDPERPPNHYRLLGIDVFESDADVIATAADRQMAHVRRYQSGSHAQASQDLLNELAAAKLLLLSPERKAGYDEELRQAAFSQRSSGVPAVRWSIAVAVVIGAILVGIVLYATSDRGNSDPTGKVLVTSNDTVRPEPAAAEDPSEDDDTIRDSPESQTSDAHDGPVEVSNGPTAEDPTEEELTEAGTTETDAVANNSETDDTNKTEPARTTSPQRSTAPPPWHVKFAKGPYPYPETGTIWDDVRLAISAGDLEAADDELASIDPSDDDSIPRGLTRIVDALKQFDLAVQHALNGKVAPGTPLEWGDSTVEFLGADSAGIHLEAANGEQKTYPANTSEMPAPLASALARLGMPKSQSAKLVLGTFWAFDQRGDIATADEHWQHARRLLNNDDVELMLTSWKSTSPSTLQQQNGTAPAQLVSVPPKSELRSTWDQIRSELELTRRSTTDQQMRDRARLLLRRGETENDTSIKYVCLWQAMDYAMRSREVVIALNAINEITTTYDVRAADLKSWLNNLRRATNDSRQLVLIAEVAVKAARAKIDDDQYDGVRELLNIAVISVRTENSGLIETAKRLQKDATVYSKSYKQVLPWREILEESPEDPKANTEFGQFLCYTKGDFSRGLPYLAKSHDESLRDLARRSLLPVQLTAMDGIDIADRWWDIAHGNQTKDFQRENIKTYARNIWYRPAAGRSGVTDAQRKHVKSRLVSE